MRMCGKAFEIVGGPWLPNFPMSRAAGEYICTCAFCHLGTSRYFEIQDASMYGAAARGQYRTALCICQYQY